MLDRQLSDARETADIDKLRVKMTVIIEAGNSNKKTLDSWATLEQQLKLNWRNNDSYNLSGKFKIDARQLGGIMTFDNLSGKFK